MIHNKMPLSRSGIDINLATVTINDLLYTGSPIQLADNMTVTYNDEPLTSADFFATGQVTALQADTYTALLTGIGRFKGRKTVVWSTAKSNVTAVKVTATWDGVPHVYNDPGAECIINGFRMPNSYQGEGYVNFDLVIEAVEPIQRIFSFELLERQTLGVVQTYYQNAATAYIDNESKLHYNQSYNMQQNGYVVLGAKSPNTLVWETRNTIGAIKVVLYSSYQVPGTIGYRDPTTGEVYGGGV